MSVSVLGCGHALPAQVVPSSEVEALAGFPEGWAARHLGIATRGRMAPEETSWDLGTRACQGALEAAGVAAAEVDLLIAHASCPELFYPDPAWYIARDLGLGEATRVMGLRAQCAGFVAALDLADAYLSTGRCQRALVVCAERMVEPALGYDRSALLFGDAAAAVVLGPGPGLRYLELRQQPAWADRCVMTAGPMDPASWPGICPELPEHWAEGERAVPDHGRVAFWEGGHIFRNAVEGMGEATLRALEATGLGPDAVDHYLYHQANAKILKSILRNFSLPADRVRSNVERVGNVSSASIPLLLSEGVATGEIRAGQRVLLGAFGSGYVLGTAILEL
ncbi:MAG: ketoacyl-ACP synthase III [Alphaproteobacteria bacterium]|nr:ketoacyl-ACP synthase III [Alphaproteobacteria bacterium]